MKINLEFNSLKEMQDFIDLAHFRKEDAAATQSDQVKPMAQAVAQEQPLVQTKPVAAMPIMPAPVAQTPVAQVPVQQPVATGPMQQSIPTAATSYTLDDLARAAMTLMDSGKQGELQGLLGQFQVEALPALPKEQYGAFATALRGLGAKI